MIGIILFLLVCSGFFSSSETSLTAASRVRMHAAEKDGDKRATVVTKLLNMRERLLGGILLGNNLVNILASVLTTALFTNIFGTGGMALVLATVVMTLLILIFAEVLPKTYAISQPDKLALIVAKPIDLIVKIFAPFVTVVQVIVNGVLRLFGVDTNASAWTAADEIKGAVDLHLQEGGVAKRARDQIYGVLEIGELDVEDVMIHRRNLFMIDINEEIVGDIQDEYDEEVKGVERLKDGSAIIRGDVPIRDLNRAMDWKLPDDEAVTIAGLVIHESQTIPTVGQAFAYHGYRFEILERQRNQIQSLKVQKTYEPDQRSEN